LASKRAKHSKPHKHWHYLLNTSSAVLH